MTFSQFEPVKQILEVTSDRGNTLMCRCPIHDDKKASLSVWLDTNGKVAYNCFAGCKHSDITKYLEDNGYSPDSIDEEVYKYTDSDGKVLYEKIRRPGKKFFIRTTDNLPFAKVRKVLYNSSKLPEETIFVVEGEKDVETLRGVGLHAVCNVEGAGKWKKEYSEQLKGKDVVILTDNDLPGEKHGAVVYESLSGVAKSVVLLTMPSLFFLLNKEPGKGWDITDWFLHGGTKELLLSQINVDFKLDKTEVMVVNYLISKQGADSGLYSRLTPEVFSTQELPQLFLALRELSFQGRLPVTLEYLTHDLSSKGYFLPTEITGLSELNENSAMLLAEELLEKSVGVKFKSMLENLSRQLDTTHNYTELVNRTLETLPTLVGQTDKPMDTSVTVREVLKSIEYRVEHNSEMSGVSTGFRSLDKLTDGLQKSDLLILAARPGVGKTALALNILEHVCFKENLRAVMFSLEMSRHQLVMRLISSLTGIDNGRLRTGDLSEQELNRVYEIAEQLAKSDKLLIDDGAGLTVHEIKRRAKQHNKKSALSLVVVDYLQLIRGSTASTREREVADISAGLKELAKELSVPVLCLAQLNRAVESRSDKRPQMSDLRDSGCIEQDADLIAFIYRPEVYSAETTDTAEIIVSKNRNGPLKIIKVNFSGSSTKFSEVSYRRNNG